MKEIVKIIIKIAIAAITLGTGTQLLRNAHKDIQSLPKK